MTSALFPSLTTCSPSVRWVWLCVGWTIEEGFDFSSLQCLVKAQSHQYNQPLQLHEVVPVKCAN